MPKNIPAQLLTVLQGQVLPIANCVRITRKDGVTIGITGHDEAITIDGVVHTPSGGASASALKLTDNTDVTDMDIVGILDDNRISEADLIAGRYNHCEVLMFQCSFLNPEYGKNTLIRGVLGEVSLEDGQFTAELRSYMSKFKQMIVWSTSPSCRVRRFGDFYCKAHASDFTDFNRPAKAVPSSKLLSFDPTGRAQGYYSNGIVKCVTGRNVGIERQIKTHTTVVGGQSIELREEFPLIPLVNEVFNLVAGCDRTFQTCRDKFSNHINFQGEPHLPGNTKIMQIARNS